MIPRKFRTESTIHGVDHLKHGNKWNRRLWAVIIFVSLALCVWQTAVNVRDYLRFNVVTANTYEMKNNLPYPAITFLNKNVNRRTVIGRTMENEVLYTMLAKRAKDLDLNDVTKTCQIHGHERDEIDRKLDMMKEKLYDSINDVEKLSSYFEEALSLVTVTKEMTFVKCWYQQTEFNCTSKVETLFISDDGWSAPVYSINVNPRVVNVMFEGTNYSVNKAYNDDQGDTGKLLSGVGNKNGYRFVLNVNAEEYCKTRADLWYGVGLHVTFHDRDMISIEPDLQSTVFLQPGFEYDVILQPKIYTRKTEHIGKCLSQYHSYIRQTNKYIKVVCQMECLMKIVWDKCGCFYLNVKAYHENFAKHHGLQVKDVPLTCWLDKNSTQCFDHVTEIGGKVLTLTADRLCSRQCKQPCDETVYNFVITTKKFRPNHLRQFYQQQLNIANDTSVEKTILVLNVFFESNLANVLVDTEMYTIRELFIYIGNNIGLFMGMSFMSLNELWYYPILVILKTRKKIAHKVKNRFSVILQWIKRRFEDLGWRSTKVYPIKPKPRRHKRARAKKSTNIRVISYKQPVIMTL